MAVVYQRGGCVYNTGISFARVGFNRSSRSQNVVLATRVVVAYTRASCAYTHAHITGWRKSDRPTVPIAVETLPDHQS